MRQLQLFKKILNPIKFEPFLRFWLSKNTEIPKPYLQLWRTILLKTSILEKLEQNCFIFEKFEIS